MIDAETRAYRLDSGCADGVTVDLILFGGGMLSARSAEQSGSGGLSASEVLQRDPAAGALWRAWAFSGPDSESGETRLRSTTPLPSQRAV